MTITQRLINRCIELKKASYVFSFKNAGQHLGFGE